MVGSTALQANNIRPRGGLMGEYAGLLGRGRRWHRGVLVSAAAGLVYAATAPAQQPTDTEDQLEEVTITAEFREANLQATPIAITAVTAEMLESRSQTNIFQVATQAPNVQLAPQGQANGSGLIAFIRGVGQTDF